MSWKKLKKKIDALKKIGFALYWILFQRAHQLGDDCTTITPILHIFLISYELNFIFWGVH